MVNNVVELKNKKLRGGLPFRIYATDCGGDYPIHGAVFKDGEWIVTEWLDNFRVYSNGLDHLWDIIDGNRYEDFKIDDKVIVWDDGATIEEKFNRHFAGISEDGKPMAFRNGKTSFTNDGEKYIIWDYCERWVDE